MIGEAEDLLLRNAVLHPERKFRHKVSRSFYEVFVLELRFSWQLTTPFSYCKVQWPHPTSFAFSFMAVFWSCGGRTGLRAHH